MPLNIPGIPAISSTSTGSVTTSDSTGASVTTGADGKVQMTTNDDSTFNLGRPVSSGGSSFEDAFNNYLNNRAGAKTLGNTPPLPPESSPTATAAASSMQVENAPVTSDLATALDDMADLDHSAQNRSETFKLSDGRIVAYESYMDGDQQKARFSISDANGRQLTPNPATAQWQDIDPSINGGKGTVDVGNGQYLNFDLKGMSLDSSNKNAGNPLTVGTDGNLVNNTTPKSSLF